MSACSQWKIGTKQSKGQWKAFEEQLSLFQAAIDKGGGRFLMGHEVSLVGHLSACAHCGAHCCCRTSHKTLGQHAQQACYVAVCAGVGYGGRPRGGGREEASLGGGWRLKHLGHFSELLLIYLLTDPVSCVCRQTCCIFPSWSVLPWSCLSSLAMTHVMHVMELCQPGWKP